MSDPYLGEIRIFGGNFAPQGWATCNGALLSISQNTALFSLLGTTYGGNGVNTFGLPNLNGRTVLGYGTSSTGYSYTQGQIGGIENITLTSSQLPAHAHTVAQPVSNAAATTSDPTGAILAQPNTGGRGPSTTSGYTTGSTGSGAAFSTGGAGGGQPFSVLSPYLVINYIIALQGIYPSRS